MAYVFAIALLVIISHGKILLLLLLLSAPIVGACILGGLGNYLIRLVTRS